MNPVFQTSYDHKDHADAASAIAAVEARGSGSVVKFQRRHNLPGLLPAIVYESCALWSFNVRGTKKWMAHDIFSGHGGMYAEELPH